jgi:hypothetical protein
MQERRKKRRTDRQVNFRPDGNDRVRTAAEGEAIVVLQRAERHGLPA